MVINYEDEEFGDYGYEYEVDYQELKKAVVKILCKNVKDKEKSIYNEEGAYQMAIYIVNDLDCLDSLCENLEDELHDFFYDKALEQMKEREENDREEQDWYGTKHLF